MEKNIKKAIKKHGLINFKKEILYIFNNSDEMYKKESEIVNEEFISRKDTYNIVLGGKGGWDYVNKTEKNLYGTNAQNIRNKIYGNKLKEILISKNKYNEWCKNISESLKNKWKKKNILDWIKNTQKKQKEK